MYDENKWITIEKYKEVNKYVYLWLIMALLSFVSIIVSAILHFNVLLVISNILLIIISVSALIHASFYKFGIKKYSYEGKLLTLKWKAFKKFLKDFSLISQYPPASLVIFTELFTKCHAIFFFWFIHRRGWRIWRWRRRSEIKIDRKR